MVGEYSILGHLASGAQGHVFAAEHPVIGKRVAIKVVNRELPANSGSFERFVMEARAVNRIGHPNIVDVFAFGMLDDGRSYCVMEWLIGETLGARIKRGRLPPSESLAILETVARALEAAHGANVIHRDLKPENVFLHDVPGHAPTVKLLDFGLAKLTGADARIDRTKTGVVLGTPIYMSPEQARGRDVGSPTDVYALGVVAFELLLGQVPFLAESATEIMFMHIDYAPPAPHELWAEIPQVLEALLLGMLEKDPSRRPAIGKVVEQLTALRATASTRLPELAAGALPVALSRVRNATEPAGASAPARRARWWIGAAVAVTLGGGLAAFVATRDPAPATAAGSSDTATPMAASPTPVTAPTPVAPTPATPVVESAPAPVPAPTTSSLDAQVHDSAGGKRPSTKKNARATKLAAKRPAGAPSPAVTGPAEPPRAPTTPGDINGVRDPFAKQPSP